MKVSQRRHPLHNEYNSQWEFYLQSFKGGEDYVAQYLMSHRLENTEDYSRRLQRAYYLNYCAPIASIPSDFIFKKDATRPTDKMLSQFRDDTNRRGTNIHEFMRSVCTLSSVYGHIHILVDRPPEGVEVTKTNGPVTKLDNLTGYGAPYATIVHPQNLQDWSINQITKQLNWIIVREIAYTDEDWQEDREVEEQFRVWTPTEWILFDDDDKEMSRGAHNLGFVPLITCYHKDVDLDLVGESMLKDVAEANRAVFNWCSNIDEMIARQTFSQLICPDDGTMLSEEVDEKGRSTALKKVGSASIFSYPADSRHPPAFISPDTKQMRTIWDMISNHVKEMFRMAGLISAKSSLIQMQQRTGRAQEFEFLDMAVFFAAKAKKLEHTENQINRMAYKWLGEMMEVPERVHYPDKFDIVSPIEIVELFTKVTLNAISGRLNKEMAKRLVHQVLPHAEDEIIFEIFDEIENNEVLEDPTMLQKEEKEPDVKTPPDKDPEKKEPEPKEEKKEKPKKEVVPNVRRPSRMAKWRAPQQKK
jgi:hypothetical protein